MEVIAQLVRVPQVRDGSEGVNSRIKIKTEVIAQLVRVPQVRDGSEG
ncbi:MAG: hypothetical protein JNL75_02300 [Chitinophagales bacterium]|nr:hypothetical protein [Chitinophagales bacterium]